MQARMAERYMRTVAGRMGSLVVAKRKREERGRQIGAAPGMGGKASGQR